MFDVSPITGNNDVSIGEKEEKREQRREEEEEERRRRGGMQVLFILCDCPVPFNVIWEERSENNRVLGPRRSLCQRERDRHDKPNIAKCTVALRLLSDPCSDLNTIMNLVAFTIELCYLLLLVLVPINCWLQHELKKGSWESKSGIYFLFWSYSSRAYELYRIFHSRFVPPNQNLWGTTCSLSCGRLYFAGNLNWVWTLDNGYSRYKCILYLISLYILLYYHI